jgi:hypothetical protein
MGCHNEQLQVADNAASRTIATILRHDRKRSSYKLTLIRVINDVVLSFPDAGTHDQPVAIPLRILAEYWAAYYWPFVDPQTPMSQGPHSLRNGALANDMAFRPALMALREAWQELIGEAVRPSDGFFLINEFRVARRRAGYPLALRQAFARAVSIVARSIEQPIRYAGAGEWEVFPRPPAYAALSAHAVAVPGTTAGDRCVLVARDLWDGFLDLSLWVEALSIHEWSLFTEAVTQPSGIKIQRGHVYMLLTDRPDNRRPLDWERNQVDLLMMEGRVFECPWTGKSLRRAIDYDLDHLLPVSVYPMLYRLLDVPGKGEGTGGTISRLRVVLDALGDDEWMPQLRQWRRSRREEREKVWWFSDFYPEMGSPIAGKDELGK